MAITQVSTSVLKDGAVTSAKLDTNIAIDGNLTVDTNTLYVDSTNNRVGIGTDSPANDLHISTVTGSARFTSTGGGSNLFMESATGNTTRIRWNSDSNFSIRNDATSTDVLNITQGGNVGIGTTSPQSKLHLQSGSGGAYNPNVNHDDLTIEGSGNVGLQLFSPANSYQYIAFGDPSSVNAGYLRYYHGANEMVFRTNGGDRLIIDGSGNVGIGISSPNSNGGAGARALHIHGPSSGDWAVTHYTNSDTGGGGGDGTVVGVIGSSKDMYMFNYEDSNIILATNSSEKMRITSGGKVGMGTTSPSSQLHVVGNTVGGDITTRFEPQSNNAKSTLYISSVSSGDGGYYYNSNNNTSGLFSYGDYTFNVGTSNISGTIGDPRMVIKQGGNVGIGTTSPNAALEIHGNLNIGDGTSVTSIGLQRNSANYITATDAAGYLVFRTGGENEHMRITSSGRVGIGTPLPAAKLHVYNSNGGDATSKASMLSEAVLKLQPHATNSTNLLFAQVNGGNGMGLQVTNGPATADWDLALSPFGGNVGIGTTSPSGKLHVNGDIRGTIFYDSDDTSFYVDPNSTSRLNKIQTSSSGATPRWDTAFYVVQGQHWYGDTASQTMYLGESGNDVLLRGQMVIGGSSVTAGYALTVGGSINMSAADINYVSQLHFADNIRFYDEGNDSYLNFKYGNASAGGIVFRNGSNSLKGYLYADNSGFGLLDNDGTWALRTQTGTSPLELRCDNNIEFEVHTSYTVSLGSSRAPIFYDSDDTTYYVDPNSTVQAANFRGKVLIGPNNSWSKTLQVGGNGREYVDNTNFASVVTTNGNLHLDSASGFATYINFYDGNVVNFGNGSNGIVGEIHSDGSARFPVFYDYNNTGYYVDPAGFSSLKFVGSEGLSAGKTVIKPSGGEFETTASTQTGAIKVTLPHSWTSTMLRMTIKVYEYTTNESFEINCGGYNYGGGSWVNNFAYIIGNPNIDRNFNVRFGHDGSKCCVYIGEGSSSWSYMQIVVTDVKLGYSYDNAHDWDSGWDVGFATSFGTISSTISNCQVGRMADIFYDSNNTTYYCDPASTTNLNTFSATRIGVNNTSQTSRYGISLYGGYSAGEPAYGILFTGTSLGTHGAVTGNWATYFTMNDDANRGWIFRNIATGNVASINNAGVAHFNGDVVAYSSSDERLKDNKKNIENALKKVESLNGVEFDWNDKQDVYEGHDIGIIAQEVEKIAPEIVNTRDNGYKAVKYEKLVPLLIEAIKELSDKVKALENK